MPVDASSAVSKPWTIATVLKSAVPSAPPTCCAALNVADALPASATVAKASHDLSDADRDAAQQRLHDERDRYPTLSASEYMLQDDWDGTFATGLQYVLDGIAGRGDVLPA